MNIRSATPTDVPAILAIERSCSTAAHWSEAEYRFVFDPGATPRSLLIAEEFAIVGFIVVRTLGPEWEIENVAVAAEHRGRGVGKALVLATFELAKSRHAESIFLEVRASNAAARALYSRAGFAQVGHRRGYYSNPDDDAVLYRFHLGDGTRSAP